MTCQVKGCAWLMEHKHQDMELVEHDPRVLNVPEITRLRTALAGLVEAAGAQAVTPSFQNNVMLAEALAAAEEALRE